jgi:1,2-diacylglycerol 3-alpha-glucosyltransferase
MKVLFVSETYYPHINGVYLFVRRLAGLLQERGVTVAVMVPSQGTHATHQRIDDIDVYGIPSLPVLYYPGIRIPIPVALPSRIKQVLKTFQPDIIHIQNHFALNKAVVKVAASMGIPLMGTNHFMTENFTALVKSAAVKKAFERWMWSEFSKVYNCLELVTAPTETAAGYIRGKLQVSVTPVSNGIDLSRYNPRGDGRQIKARYGLPEGPVLLSVGRLDPEKRIEEVLYGMAKALDTLDFHLVIVGKGIKRMALERMAMELGISRRVIFAGYVPDEDLPYFYNYGHCFITASIAELQSIATMEAMASGLPVIAADAGALCELVHDGINGYLFEPGDTDRIGSAMVAVLKDAATYHAMGQRSLEIISDHDIQKSVRVYEEMYQGLTARRAAV